MHNCFGLLWHNQVSEDVARTFKVSYASLNTPYGCVSVDAGAGVASGTTAAAAWQITFLLHRLLLTWHCAGLNLAGIAAVPADANELRKLTVCLTEGWLLYCEKLVRAHTCGPAIELLHHHFRSLGE